MDIFKLKKRLARAALAVTACALVACGGGGHGLGGGTPSAPTLSLTPQGTKTFHFSWAPVSGATRYVLLEDPDGASGYQPASSDDLPASVSAYDHEVFLPARVNARYVLQACNAAGCADSAAIAVSGTLAQATGYVKASAPISGGAFGTSVAISRDGQTMAVGSLNFGAYVFTRSGSAWQQQAFLLASNFEPGDNFGYQVALSGNGDVLAVSATLERGNGTGTTGDENDNSALRSGAVYVFRRTAGAWAQEAYVKASNTQADDLFGNSLALSANGTTLAVGASREDSGATGIDGDQADNSATDSGAVYVFAHDGSGWAQEAYVKASNTDAGDNFGLGVALSADGNTLAVGASGEDSNVTGTAGGNQADNSVSGSGATYVFTRSNGHWSQQAYLKASNPSGPASFAGLGQSVVLSADGDTLAASALGEQGSSGAVYVFTRGGNNWTQQARLTASLPQIADRFGSHIAVSPDGDTLAVGAVFEDSAATGINGNQADNSATDSGALYVFNRRSGTWAQQAYVKAPNTDADDRFGGGVETGGAGRLALGGEGRSLILAAGTPNEDSGATGVNSAGQADNSVPGSGAVYLY